jgi:hypothetical protein
MLLSEVKMAIRGISRVERPHDSLLGPFMGNILRIHDRKGREIINLYGSSPLSPTIVRYPMGNPLMNACALASLAASSTCQGKQVMVIIPSAHHVYGCDQHESIRQWSLIFKFVVDFVMLLNPFPRGILPGTLGSRPPMPIREKIDPGVGTQFSQFAWQGQVLKATSSWN